MRGKKISLNVLKAAAQLSGPKRAARRELHKRFGRNSGHFYGLSQRNLLFTSEQ